MAGLGVLRGRVFIRGGGVGGARGRALLHPVEDGVRGQGAAALRGRGRDPLRRESLGDKAENIYYSTGLSTIIDVFYLRLRSIKRPQIQF